jgi:alpha-D-ribose 1-methylphosphonate 5-triphosphate diphosphatase
MNETILTNAVLVLPDAVCDGTVVVSDGRIVDVQPGRSYAQGALDLAGDYLMPGVVDVHTDNLERQVQPRQNARWPSRSAMIAHDIQCAAAGVTTVLDALCLGDLGFDTDRLQTSRDGVADLDALADTGLLKSEHFLHLRCEMPAADVLSMADRLADHPRVRMMSLMDHSPGVGQYADLERYRWIRRRDGVPEQRIERRIQELTAQRERLRTPNRRALLARFAPLGVVIASHDEETEAEVAENHATASASASFPSP